VSDPTRTTAASDPPAGLGGWLAWLLVLPVLLLAWPGPGQPLADDPFPHLAATGWVAALAGPLGVALFFARRRVFPNAAWLLVAWTAVAAIGELRGASDALEARTAWVLAAAVLTAFVGGAHLGPRGRERLAQLAALTALAYAVGALVGGLPEDGHLAGTLGDTGSLSQTALPGAVLGAWLLVRGRGGTRLLGGAAALAFALHAAWAPVLAGALAFGAGLAALALRADVARPARGVLAALAVVPLLGAGALIGLAREEAPAGEAPAAAATDSAVQGATGGFEVRWRVWRATLAMTAAHPLLGVGPGQFQAAFPPWRDPVEEVLSRQGPCSEDGTEVEHAHDDYLQALAEGGLVGGLPWLLFAGLMAVAAWRALASEEVALAGCGAAALALLANGLLHAPLTENPTSAVLGAVLFGTLVTAPSRAGRPGAGLGAALLASPRLRDRFHGLGLAGLILAAGLLGLPMIAQGLDMVQWMRSARELAALKSAEPPAPEEEVRRVVGRARAAVARAIETPPAGAPALLAWARTTRGADDWGDVLARRPHSVEALEGIGLAHARNARYNYTWYGLKDEKALGAWEEALELVPGFPRILRNLARLGLEQGEPETGLARLRELDARGCLDLAFVRGMAADFALSGLFDPALALAAFAEDPTGPYRRTTSGESLERASEAAAASGEDRVADALRELAHLVWAREHADAGDFPTAVRSYRQALLSARRQGERGTRTLVAELGAAELRAGRSDEAGETLAPITVDERLAEQLPAWAQEALRAADYVH